MPNLPRRPSEQTFREAVRLALHDAMTEDPHTIFIGLGATDPGAIFGTAEGLAEAFGPERVFDGPTSENAMTGVGVGAAIAGLKPIMSHQRLDFFLLAMDQLVNSAAKWHFMFGGEVAVPLTIRLVLGRGWGQGPTHSQNLQAWFAHVPGLKVVVPTFPKDAYGLLRASIQDPNPVIFLEHRWLHNASGDMSQDHISGRTDRARVARSGNDVTICATGLLTLEALRAAQWLASEGVDCDVIDLRTLNPIDWETVLSSVGRTRRLVVCDPAPVTASVASEIVATATVELFHVLESAPIRLAHPDLPEPTSSALTHDFHVGAADIAKAVLQVLGNAVPADLSMLKPHDPHDVPGPWFAGPF